MIFSSNAVIAGAFSLYAEANGRNAGDFAAGAAVEAIDASMTFYNPAGLIYLENSQVVASGNYINIKADFSGTSILNDVIGPPDPPISIDNVDGGGNAGVPSIYASRKLNSRLAWGIGVFVPFGLETDWADTEGTRYAATKTKLQIIDLSPAFAVEITSRISVGAALDIQFANVDFDSMVGLPGGLIGDSTSLNTGRSTGFGGHAGIIVEPIEHVMMGLNYQSKVKHQFFGTSTLTGPLAGADGEVINRGLFSDPAYMPAQTTLSVMGSVNDKLTLLGSFSYVQWSLLPELVLNGVAAQPGNFVDVTIKENFKDTVRVALGGKYQLGERLLLRCGLGYDQTPVKNDELRNLRLPDNDRFALAVGGHYQATNAIGLDVGWTHLFIYEANINNVTDLGVANVTINGDVKGNANIFGGQVTWKLS